LPKKKNPSCAYCSSTRNLTVDHVIPISRWRELRVKRRVLDNESNRVIACMKCNSEKKNMMPAEWFALHPEFKACFQTEAKYLSDLVRKYIS
jgi:5-methylcytosine-specific restriction endonuclease McrA